MKTLVVGAAALVLFGTALRAGAAQQRYVPFTLLGGNGIYTYLGGQFGPESHPPHGSIMVASTKAGARKLMRLVKPEDQDRLRQIDFRQSIVVAGFADYGSMSDFCRRNLTLRRIRLIERRVDAIATVEGATTNCMSIPEMTGVHLYSLGTFPRRFAAKVPKSGFLAVRDVPSS